MTRWKLFDGKQLAIGIYSCWCTAVGNDLTGTCYRVGGCVSICQYLVSVSPQTFVTCLLADCLDDKDDTAAR
jgi:hypothetical protein